MTPVTWLELSKSHTQLQLTQNLAQLGLLEPAPLEGTGDAPTWEVLGIRANAPLEGAAIAWLCAWGLLQKQQGRSLEFVGDPKVLRYLSRVNLLGHLGASDSEKFRRHSEAGRFIPLTLLQDAGDVYQAVNQVCDLVLAQVEGARAFIPALEWATNEVMDNVLIHAQAPVPGVLMAQYYPKKALLELCICDMGRGIRQSLSESHPTSSDTQALELAVQRGITRNIHEGQGNGLAGTLQIVERNGGRFTLWSGTGRLQGTGDPAKITKTKTTSGNSSGKPNYSLAGTGVSLALHTQNAVALEDTFIANSSGETWGYLQAKAETLALEGSINIALECIHTGGRPPARVLRQHLLQTLAHSSQPLILDFSEVSSASSSFLDELLGRLALELGLPIFEERIQITAMNPTLQRMAQVVIRQRLES
jgi:anti-sigma regulatory factor (Ser/Thr protein kinase)